MKKIVSQRSIQKNYWRFICEWLPDYTTNNLVMLAKDLASYLELGDAASPDCKGNIIDNGGTLSNKAQLQALAIDTNAELMRQAMTNFLMISYK